MTKRYSEQGPEDRHEELMEQLTRLADAAERIAAALEKPRRRVVRNG